MFSKGILPKVFILIIIVVLFCSFSYAQRASAEFITSYAPGKLETGEQVNDGIQNLFYKDGRLYVSNVWAGLQILDVSAITKPVEIGAYRVKARTHNVYVDDQYVYLANELSGVSILDASTPAATRLVSTIQTIGDAFWVVAKYPFLYVAEETHGINIYDITNLAAPQHIGGYDTPGWAWGVDLNDNTLYVADKNGGLLILDVSDPRSPKKLGQLTSINNAKTVQFDNNLAYIANGPDGLVIVDVSNSAFPKLLSTLTIDGFVFNASKYGNSVFLSNELRRRVEIIDVTDPAKPVKEGDYTYEGKIYSAIKHDVYVYVAADISTLILRHNHPPVLTQIENQTVDEVSLLNIVPDGYDPDGDQIYYTIENLPEGATFDSLSGQISWTPTYEQSGLYPEVTITAWEITDSRLSTSTTFDITVNHVNRNPSIPDISDTTVFENQILVIRVPEGSDPDVEDRGRLFYSASNRPEGAEFDSLALAFRWQPTYEQSGIYTIDFAVHDPAGGVMRDAATITVIHVDRKPVLAEVEPQTVNENELLTITLSGSDPDAEDQDKLSYRAVNLPEGSSFDAQTATFSWTPTYDQSGEYGGILFIFNAGAMSDSVTVDITVVHVNRNPVLAAIPDNTINENENLNFVISGSDPDVEDQGKLTFSAANLPQGAVFNPDSLKFNWTPDFEQSAEYENVLFMLKDPDGLSDSATVKLTVVHVNRTPVLAEIEPKTINENELLTFELSGSDPDIEDKDKLVYSAEGLPEGAQLTGTTVTWTPTYDQSGVYTIKFTLNDGQLSDSKETTFTVIHVNRPPVMDAITAQTVNENELLTFSVTGSDPDKEDLNKWRFTALNLPLGAVFDTASAQFSWTPTFEQSGSYTITFVNTDPGGLTDSKETVITVNHVNRTPVFPEQPAQTVDENILLTYKLIPAEDPDTEDEGKLVYTAENMPEGAGFDPQTLTLTWTPTYEQSGSYTITFKVADSEFTVAQPLMITVNHINRPPVIDVITAPVINENAAWTFKIPYSDPDKEDEGKLVVSVDNLPQGALFNAQSAEITWTPGFEQAGNFENITVSVTDPAGLSDQKSFNITVANVNRLPVIDPVTDVKGKENEPVSFSVTGSDPDPEQQDKLAFSAEGLPAGASFDPASKTFSWTPGYDQAGDHTITIKLSDGEDEVSSSVKVSIENVNREPAIEGPGAGSVQAGSRLSLKFTGSDPDNDRLEFSGGGLPSGASVSASGELSWTPADDQVGSHTITIKVSDGEASAEMQTTIEVSERPAPPPPAPADTSSGL
ncbi:MAG: putative Ig domain-containing protein [Calditrichaceae bacterium]|nr:putative Ig domain-containing protein [Calditrichaceae bacterium]MBN2709060.1 putative Ig domain-containing protein [Calditrichaceae bacterium]RQV97018.1 MAG: hypothetical protein EH224_02670 [Calditrichota bacterium]